MEIFSALEPFLTQRGRVVLLFCAISFINSLSENIENDVCLKKEDCDNLSTNEGKAKENSNNFKTVPPLNDRTYLINENELPQILWWYQDLYPHHSNKEIRCKLGSCFVTKDRKQLVNRLTRGIMFYGTSFDGRDLPLPRLPHHEWALIHEESPKNERMFSNILGISLFNHTATFRRESDFPLTTQNMQDVKEWMDKSFFVTTNEKNRLKKKLDLAAVVYFQRDCDPPSDRDTYVKELMKYIKIDSYGPCLNNKKPPKEIDGFQYLSSKPYYHFLARYKFQLAFENYLCQDYMTEKLFRPLIIGSVPVYLGSPLAEEFMPSEKSVIMVRDFGSPKQLAEYLKQLDADDEKYNEYLMHRYTGKFSNPKLRESLKLQRWSLPEESMFTGFSCHVCDELIKRNEYLKKHLENPQNEILPMKIAKFEHMGCPKQSKILPHSTKNNYEDLLTEYAEQEAIAINMMLHANETDSRLFTKKYLKITTDNYY